MGKAGGRVRGTLCLGRMQGDNHTPKDSGEVFLLLTLSLAAGGPPILTVSGQL